MIIAGSGKRIADRMAAHASRDRIEAEVGRPIREERFSPPYPSTGPWYGPAGWAVCKAVYRYHGRADDMVEFQGLGMLVGMTCGLGEIVAFPEAIKLSKKLDRSNHLYVVWYDSTGRCIAYDATHDFADW